MALPFARTRAGLLGLGLVVEDKFPEPCTYMYVTNFILNFAYRHDGLIIMATNRPYDLDEAMHRRIMIAIEFRQPDHLLRKAIWKSHIPEQMTLKDDIDLVWLYRIARKFGGELNLAVWWSMLQPPN